MQKWMCNEELQNRMLTLDYDDDDEMIINQQNAHICSVVPGITFYTARQSSLQVSFMRQECCKYLLIKSEALYSWTISKCKIVYKFKWCC